MRTLLLLITLFVFIPAYAAEPCTKATEECTRWINLGGEARSLVYSTYPLNKKNEQIVRALIVVHGQGRDADNYFRTSLAATFLANAFNDTIVISPRLASNNGTGCRDKLAPNEVHWYLPISFSRALVTIIDAIALLFVTVISVVSIIRLIAQLAAKYLLLLRLRGFRS